MIPLQFSEGQSRGLRTYKIKRKVQRRDMRLDELKYSLLVRRSAQLKWSAVGQGDDEESRGVATLL